MGIFKDLKGKRFGKYKVLEYSGDQKWKCICDCGTISYIKGNTLTSGRSSSCKKCSRRLSQGETGLNRLYDKYRRSAKNKDREFTLSKEEFKIITSSNCHYCGTPPEKISLSSYNTSEETKKHSTYLYNGIDRVDNNLGYNSANSVPCCEICNKAKRDLSYEIFIEYLNKIVKYYDKIRNSRP